MFHSFLRHRLFTPLFLGGCFLILLLLWLPGLRYPVVSDTVVYAYLGRSFWEHGTYMFLGSPFAKHLPLQAILSYPFTQVFGLHLGMHISTLVAGWAVLCVTFLLVRRVTTVAVAVLTTASVLVHPGFILMSMLGSADLLFCALFLAALLAYVHAEKQARWYVLCGIFTGLACLTRYNGLPLFPFFFLYTAWRRRADLGSSFFWGGMIIGALILVPWLARNALVFGNPLHTEYAGELTEHAPDLRVQMLSNVMYYINPIHNIFPFFFPFALLGLWLYGRRHLFLIFAMLAASAFALIWWVQAIRFAFPAFVLLLMFSALGIRTVLDRSRWPVAVSVSILFSFAVLQGLSVCLYTYGACNALFDRTVGIVPPNMGLSPEGFHSWAQSRDYLDAHAEQGAAVVAGGSFAVSPLREDVFRPDLRVFVGDEAPCPHYRIAQEPVGKVLFQTEDAPVSYVSYVECPAGN